MLAREVKVPKTASVVPSAVWDVVWWKGWKGAFFSPGERCVFLLKVDALSSKLRTADGAEAQILRCDERVGRVVGRVWVSW
jgi:hypothetical protein